MKSAVRFLLVVLAVGILSGCDQLVEYKKSRQTMTTMMVEFDEVLNRDPQPDFLAEAFLLGKLVNDLKSYTVQLSIAADSTSAIIKNIVKYKEPTLDAEQKAIRDAVVVEFSAAQREALRTELMKLEKLWNNIYLACGKDRFRRNCMAAYSLDGRFADNAIALWKNHVKLTMIAETISSTDK